MNIQTTTTPTNEDKQVIRDGLAAYNVAKVPSLLDLPSGNFSVVVRDVDQTIVGGAIGEFDWGYLYTDTLWVAEQARGQGYASQIMQALESFAAQRGINKAYLFTTSFQAQPFYEKIGYRIFGTNEERPRGYTTTYMVKDNLQVNKTNLDVQFPPKPADWHFLNAALIDDIEQQVALEQVPYAIFLRDDGNSIKGGLWGNFFWDWFDLHFLWIAEELRGKGYAKLMMEKLFDECDQRKCVGIICDTASFQAIDFYLALGFEVFGKLQDRPPGHESYFIQKMSG